MIGNIVITEEANAASSPSSITRWQIALHFIPPVCLIISTVAGWPLWKAYAPLANVPISGWVWFIGSFVAFAGGVIMFRSSRILAVLCSLGGFAVFFSAVIYLTGAIRSYHDQFRAIS